MAASTHHSDYQLLLDLLKETRHRSCVTQVELAARLGNTQTFISKVERGERRLDAVEFVEYLEALEVKPEQWLGAYIVARGTRPGPRKSKRKISAR
jgi:transcriptional regulator with XRE-family HTH domain